MPIQVPNPKIPKPAKSPVSAPALTGLEDAPEEGGNNKTESAYRTLRQAILDGKLAPSTPLRQSNLSATYGIGWTPLREALSRLKTERLVTLQRNRGFSVAPVSLVELKDLTRARRTLELAMLAESIDLGDAAWEEALVIAHYRLKTCALQSGEWSESAISNWILCHQVFHCSLLAGSQSPWLMHLYNQVMVQERRQLRLLMFAPLRQEFSRAAEGEDAPAHSALLMDAVDVQHHTDLMEAALARDIPRATALVDAHVRYKADVFVNG